MKGVVWMNAQMDNINEEALSTHDELNLLLEETEEDIEVTGTWGSAGTFASSVGGCASTAATASSFG